MGYFIWVLSVTGTGVAASVTRRHTDLYRTAWKVEDVTEAPLGLV